MKTRSKLSSVLVLLAALGVTSAQAQILPPNDLHLQDGLFLDTNIDETTFNAIIDEVAVVFAPIIETHGAKLKTNKLWSNSTVNASAQQMGSTWIVNMYGGLARRPEVTPDGFALVVCHELGHHLGGYAFYEGGDWAASEGQADYYATQACARAVWKDQLEKNAKSRLTVDLAAKAKCDEIWTDEASQNLCYRIAMGGQSLATLLSALRKGGVPKFETPDPSQVSKTSTSHPQAQCRLDTYFNGALCAKDFDINVIPGRKHPVGQDTKDAEIDAYKQSCGSADGFKLGYRPRCWFGPLVKNP